jgi:hypothetical protein
VPAGLDLAAFKRRVDSTKESQNPLLEELLEEAFEQAQAPFPYGCGRLLAPNPGLVETDPGDPEADPPVPATYADTADPVAVTVEPRDPRKRRVLIPDARLITQVSADGATVASTGDSRYTTFAHRGHVVQLTLPVSCESVTVTGRFGFVALPVSLRGAIYTLAARMWHERDQQFADQVPAGDGAPAQAFYRQLPVRVKLVFAGFRVPAGIAGAA